MACFSGPEINQTGLVFHFDISNIQKSWKGKPTTNLASGNFFNGNGNFTVNQNVSDIMPDGSVGIARELNAQTVVDANRTVSIGSYSLTAGSTYTLSFYVKNINCTGFNGNLYSPTLSRVIGGITYPQTNNASWTRVVTTFTVPNEGPNPVVLSPQVFRDGGFGLFRMTWLMLEEGSVVSAYTPTSRSTTQSILDLTGNNTITASNLTYSSNGLFSFNGTSDFLRPNINHSYLLSSAIEVWFRSTSHGTGKKTIMGYAHNGGYSAPTIGSLFLEGSNLQASVITASQVYRIAVSTTTINTNRYYHAVLNKDTTTGLLQIYLNGKLNASQTFDPATYGQWTTAGQFIGTNVLDIGKSTNTSEGQGWSTDFFSGDIPVAKVYNRVLTSSEIQQNFEATRSRYGL